MSMTWEERWHPLRQEWVIVAAHRGDRPWHGEQPSAPDGRPPRYSPGCHLCPGNTRVSGRRNPEYEGVFVFDNDHPCVGSESPSALASPVSPFRSRRADGVARVVCYTPRHDLPLADLGHDGVVGLLETLQSQCRELAERPEVRHVLVFENRGELVGVSNPHPHCQVYATNFVFRTMEQEAEVSAAHVASGGPTLLEEVIDAEEGDGRRMLSANHGAVAFVPYFARYPYETFVTPRAAHHGIEGLSAAEVDALAAVLRDTLVRYDNLWGIPFPYVMVLHQAPADGRAHPGFHFHIEIYPPLRRPGLRKYLAGPEIGGGNFINSSAPEAAAAELRSVPGPSGGGGGDD